MKISTIPLASIALALSLAFPAVAGPARTDIERLGADLTPAGAEKAGSKDGAIPAWDGGLSKAPAGWSPGQPYADPFADEKPLFTITGQNAEQYKDKLSPGLLELLKKYPTFRMPVYPSHRTVALPKAVTDQAKAQADKVEIEGFGVKNLGTSNIPFPIPKTGIEVLWNHLVRYTGGGLEDDYSTFLVRGSGDYSRFGLRLKRIYAGNLEGARDGELMRYMSFYTYPASLEGTIYLVQDPVNQVESSRAAWIYNAGQRRVRRAPDLAYDMITDGSEGMYVVDQVDGYNGAPDRYDWKLLGKKELYVAYNSYKIGDKSLKYADIIQKSSINPDVVRYEPHRVWVVEGTLKSGAKHLYGKRTFYIDEDSWNVLLEDAYDTRGGLWRVGIHGLIQYYDAQVPLYGFNLWHDLTSGGYALYGINNETRAVRKIGTTGKASDFEPDALRRAGTK
ncbi:DUF1329 domain-containing protein [Magnetospirillum sp. 15-1]|uniref:DUF1329 domain-containing protein n=1 Tax=Magnetospirillum sp. 15-1 TaxID=1979370 RepID=UPI000BBC8C1A|nr:DUF1329 domain-containing protein [Magnetospirillum sp. 15-1]